MGNFDPTLRIDTIHSGKLRRYHSLSSWQQLTNFRAIVLPNLRDSLFVAVGLLQSFVKLIAWRPDVVFTKGGYVCLPIGLAARVLGIPLVIHDSDAHPGLTNRMLAKWATSIGTGAPLKFYPYPISRSHYVGVPVGENFQEPFDVERRAQVKRDLGLDVRPLVVITGVGLGARRINDAIASILHDLLERANVILISGERQYDELRATTPQDDPRYQLHAFVSDGMAMMLGAADVVVARAGATTILELAGLAKPTILIPNGLLTGGHQLKNAAVYAEKGAVSVVDEDALEKHPDVLMDEIVNILADTRRQETMARAFHAFAKPHAARDMAGLVLSAVKR